MPRQFNGKYEFDQNGINEIISEKGDIFLALREVRWSENKPFKLDLRHYRSDEFEDKTLKGCSFTDDDADDLVKILIENGFGENEALVDAITSSRPDLCYILKEELNSDCGMAKEDARKKLFERRQTEDEEMDESGYFERPDESYYRPEDLLGA